MAAKTRKVNKHRPKDAKSIAQSQGTDNGMESARTESGLSLEAENQFEVELCWCIQQLQATLESGKLPEKQVADLKRNLNALRSNSASLIRKRQIMRNTLGDYRQKMMDDERRFGRAVHNVIFTCKTPAASKSTFLRKGGHSITQEQSDKISEVQSVNDRGGACANNEVIMKNCTLGESFRFNFNSSD